MRITQLETIRVPMQPNLLFVVLHTDSGATGLGESFFGARAVEAYIHETVAPVLLSLESVSPESAHLALRSYLGYQSSGVETRGNAAVDIALWDLLGKEAELPLARLLGGPVFSSIGVYNTCAGPSYVRHESARQSSSNWGLGQRGDQFEDLEGFLTRPGKLALELLDDGYTAMKIWPFDRAAEASRGTDISAADLAEGLRVIEEIREVAGDRMRILLEMHGLWQGPAAAKIVRAAQPYGLYWIEDPVRPDSVHALQSVADATDTWIASGETLTGQRGFRPLLERNLLDVVTVDVMWSGGLTEARKIAALADGYGVPFAPHDCTGPVALAACAHLVMSQPNGLIQETTRAFIRTWYDEVAEGVPPISDGRLTLTDRPGHGVTLRPDLRDLPGVLVTTAAGTR